jgi:flagellar basal body rod protein FlgG
MVIAKTSSSALSGLDSASKRLNVSAHNVANVGTDGFQASRVVDQEALGGGVTSFVEPIDQSNPMLFRDGQWVLGSNTDLASEVVNRIQAIAAFKANVKMLQTADETQKSLIDTIA